MADDQPENAEAAEEEYQFKPAELSAGVLAAAKLGNRSLLERLISCGAAVDTADAQQWTPLHFASFYGHHRVVELLLQHKAGESVRVPHDALRSDGSGASSSHKDGGGVPAVRIVNSPLHHAVSRLHIRVVWALLHAGFSPLDVDQYGNNCLHLVSSSSFHDRPLQLEVLRTLLTHGHDAGLRNWLGQTPLDVLPHDATEARKLLHSSASHTKCGMTGTPFGNGTLRHMCHASGAWVCEDAAVTGTAKAFAPRIPGTTTSEDDAPTPRLGLLTDPIPYGFGVGGLPVATLGEDASLLRPLRYAAEVSFKVQDAEAALDAALTPFTGAVEEAYGKWKVEVSHARAAALVLAREGAEAQWHADVAAAKAAKVAEEERVKAEAEAAAKAAEEEAAAKKGKKGGKGAPAVPTKAPSRAQSAKSQALPAPSALEDGEGGEGGDTHEPEPEPEPVMPEFVPPTFPDVPPSPPSPEPDFFFSAAHTTAVQAGLTALKEVRGDPHLQAKALVGLRRLKSAEVLRDACAALGKARPLLSLDAAAYVGAVAAFEASRAAGVGPSLLAQAQLALHIAAAEVELSGAVHVASGVSIGTHAYDAFIHRLAESVARGTTLAAAAASAAAPEQLDVEHFSLRHVLGVPAGNEILPAPPKEALCAQGGTLLSRLQCEVQVTDALGAAKSAGTAAKDAAEKHREDDPTELPIPELPTAPSGDVPSSRPPSGKGAPAAPVDPAAPLPAHPDFPLDSTGVAVPHTPQLLSLMALRKACRELDTVVTASRSAGADAACIEGAVAGLAELRAAFDVGLADEVARVSTARAEKAKAAKKGKKKGK